VPMILGIEQEGAVVLAQHFDESGVAASDMFAVLARIVQDLMFNTAKQFYSKGHRGGGSWAELAPSTIRQKGHSAILIDTKDLIRSVTQPGAEYQILEFTESGFEFGTERPYAYTHQEGRGQKTRPFLVVLQSDVDKWHRWMGEHITKPFDQPTV